jgi:hypothetical protein
MKSMSNEMRACCGRKPASAAVMPPRRGEQNGRRLRFPPIVCVFLLCSGCVSYTYGKVSYRSSEEALAAAQKDIDASLMNVPEAETPVSGRVVVLIPDRARIRERAVFTRGNPNQGQIDYIVEGSYRGIRAMGETLRKSKSFDTVVVQESKDPQGEAASTVADYVVWLNLADQNTAQWYIAHGRNNRPRPVPVDLAVEPPQRGAAWAKSVRQAAMELAAFDGKK